MATVTLTTDFGDGSSYVAALKGSLLAINPAASLLDLSHRLPPQNLAAAAWFLADTLPWFPTRTIHVVVVDPGVGTARPLLCVEWAGQLIVVPDNGCWTSVLRLSDPVPRVYRLENRQFWCPVVSATFHGRDILAPVAGHLSLGVKPAEFGPVATGWVQVTLPRPVVRANVALGEVVVVDSFGNLVTNLRAENIASDAVVGIGGTSIARLVHTYGDAEPGALVALIGSTGRLEIAVVNGSAAIQLNVGVGTAVEVRRSGSLPLASER